MNSELASVELQVESAFPFTVEKFPLSGPELGMSTPFYGLFRSDTGDSVGSACTQRYEPHTTADVVALGKAASTVFEAEDFKVQTHFNNGHYLSLAPSADYRRRIIGTTDDIFPRLYLSGRYDSRSFSASIGYYRDACANLSMLRSVKSLHVSIKHNSCLRDKMDDLIQTFSALKGGWTRLCEVIDRLESREVQLAEFLTEVYGPVDKESSVRSRNNHKARTEAIFSRILRERMRTSRPDLKEGEWIVSAWEALNGVQGFSQHNATRRGGASLNNFGRALLASNDPNVRRAEQLAMSA